MPHPNVEPLECTDCGKPADVRCEDCMQDYCNECAKNTECVF